MSTKSTLKEDIKADINKRSEEELLEKKSGISKHWIALLNLIKTGANQILFIGDSYEFKKITILNFE